MGLNRGEVSRLKCWGDDGLLVSFVKCGKFEQVFSSVALRDILSV